MTAASNHLVVGVTGHRKLADPGLLAAKIDAVLDEITREAPGQGLVVLSPLAEGADRLVAARALVLPGAALEAVLPLDEADYERDFETDASRAEFRSLLARARRVRRLPPSSSREEAYAAAGRFVVDHCDVLVAIWDGQIANGPGGTANIVAYARSRARRLSIVEP
jgi:hypothetical protein